MRREEQGHLGLKVIWVLKTQKMNAEQREAELGERVKRLESALESYQNRTSREYSELSSVSRLKKHCVR